MKMFKPFAALFAAATILTTAAQAQQLNVGDPAPPIKVAQWVKGVPVQNFEKGKVYVVEFWATWCGPCRQSIPHLTELAGKFAGKVTFSGISVWERGDGIPKQVTDFVTQMGDKMNYNVALDEPAGTMASTWMKAAAQNGIPAAFIVDGDGVVAWVGHPMGDLEKNLEAVLAGTFDLEKSKADFAAEAVEKRKEIAFSDAVGKARETYLTGDKAEALRQLDKLATENPQRKATIDSVAVNLMVVDDFEGAVKRVDAVAKTAKAENAVALAGLGSVFVNKKELASNKKAADYGLKIILKANDVAKGKSLQVLNLIAATYWKRKDAAKAVEYQQKAVDLFPTSEFKDNPQVKQSLDKTLAFYKAGFPPADSAK